MEGEAVAHFKQPVVSCSIAPTIVHAVSNNTAQPNRATPDIKCCPSGHVACGATGLGSAHLISATVAALREMRMRHPLCPQRHVEHRVGSEGATHRFPGCLVPPLLPDSWIPYITVRWRSETGWGELVLLVWRVGRSWSHQISLRALQIPDSDVGDRGRNHMYTAGEILDVTRKGAGGGWGGCPSRTPGGAGRSGGRLPPV